MRTRWSQASPPIWAAVRDQEPGAAAGEAGQLLVGRPAPRPRSGPGGPWPAGAGRGSGLGAGPAGMEQVGRHDGRDGHPLGLGPEAEVPLLPADLPERLVGPPLEGGRLGARPPGPGRRSPPGSSGAAGAAGPAGSGTRRPRSRRRARTGRRCGGGRPGRPGRPPALAHTTSASPSNAPPCSRPTALTLPAPSAPWTAASARSRPPGQMAGRSELHRGEDGRQAIARTFWAWSPFGPLVTSNSTRCPSSRLR